MLLKNVQTELRNALEALPCCSGYDVIAWTGLNKPDVDESLATNKAVFVVYPPLTVGLVSQSKGECILQPEITVGLQLIGNRTVTTVDGVETENYNFVFDIFNTIQSLVDGVLNTSVDSGDRQWELSENPIQLSTFDSGELAYDITFKKQCVI